MKYNCETASLKKQQGKKVFFQYLHDCASPLSIEPEIIEILCEMDTGIITRFMEKQHNTYRSLIKSSAVAVMARNQSHGEGEHIQPKKK
jgi:hypothetical protein